MNNGNSLWFKKLLRLIAKRFATKTELSESSDEWAAATSALQKNKLEVDGSNASSTTTYNVLNSAAGGGNAEITDDEEIILTFPKGSTAYKRALKKFIEYLRSKLIRDSFSPPTSTNVAPTVGAVTTVIENKEKNLKETYFDAAPISINKDVENAILEIPYSSAPDLYQRIYELNISSNIAHQTNFKIIFCPAVNSSKSFTTNARAYILGFSNDTTRGLFRFCTTSSGVVLTCKYTSDNSSSATRQIAISMNIARGTGFTKVNKPITDYKIISSFYLNDSTYVKPYVTSDELNTAINNIRKENYSWTNASTYNGFIGMPMTICWNGGTSVDASTLFGYGSDYSDDGRILVFVNGTSVSVSVRLTDGSYSVSKGRTLLIVKWGGSYFPMNDKT